MLPLTMALVMLVVPEPAMTMVRLVADSERLTPPERVSTAPDPASRSFCKTRLAPLLVSDAPNSMLCVPLMTAGSPAIVTAFTSLLAPVRSNDDVKTPRLRIRALAAVPSALTLPTTSVPWPSRMPPVSVVALPMVKEASLAVRMSRRVREVESRALSLMSPFHIVEP